VIAANDGVEEVVESSDTGDVFVDTDASGKSVAPVVTPEEERQAEKDRQKEHDDKVLGDMYPGEGNPGDDMRIAGIEMDTLSLTTLKWLRRAGSGIIEGNMPEDMDVILREIGMFLLAHNKALSVEARARIFLQHKDVAFEIALDETLHGVPIAECTGLFEKIVAMVASQTSTLVVPVPDEDQEDKAEIEGNV